MRQAPGRVWSVVEPVVSGMGYELVGAALGGKPGDRLLRIYVDTSAGITVDDCEAVSRQLSALFDIDDPVGEGYTLEVSSPGIDRPLFREADFHRFVGEEAFVRLLMPLEGRRRFRGRLQGCDAGAVLMEVDGSVWRLPLESMEEAHLIGQV